MINSSNSTSIDVYNKSYDIICISYIQYISISRNRGVIISFGNGKCHLLFIQREKGSHKTIN